MSDTVRVEVIANRSIQEDFLELLEAAEVGQHYTLLPEVQGVGHAGPRRGDHIWPEENFVFVTYVGEEEARAVREQVEAVRSQFPTEGIRMFATRGIDL
ncbi:MAG: PG0541 family transporter-associated protein [Alkalispirochaeta sp.]